MQDEEYEELRREVGANIQRARNIKGWNQDQVAEVLGCSRAHVSRVEKGHTEFNPSQLIVLARALGIDVSWLLEIRVNSLDRVNQ